MGPLLKKPTITTMMKLLMLIPMHNAMDHLHLPSRDWLKELPLLKKPTITTMMKLLMLIPMHNAMDHLHLPSRDLGELPLLKKPTIMTMILLLILDIKSMDQRTSSTSTRQQTGLVLYYVLTWVK